MGVDVAQFESETRPRSWRTNDISGTLGNIQTKRADDEQQNTNEINWCWIIGSQLQSRKTDRR